MLVNRYYKSDKLGLHVEDTAAFGEIIVGISLGSTDYLRLVEVNNQ
jgi:alkylated DNA repair dioxygenase AlkB